MLLGIFAYECICFWVLLLLSMLGLGGCIVAGERAGVVWGCGGGQGIGEVLVVMWCGGCGGVVMVWDKYF